MFSGSRFVLDLCAPLVDFLGNSVLVVYLIFGGPNTGQLARRNLALRYCPPTCTHKDLQCCLIMRTQRTNVNPYTKDAYEESHTVLVSRLANTDDDLGGLEPSLYWL